MHQWEEKQTKGRTLQRVEHVAGTGATAVLAARIPQAQYIAPLELEPEVEDGVGMCRERVSAARADADRAKSDVGLRQAVRQDMRLRAKVPPVAAHAHSPPFFTHCSLGCRVS